MPVAELITPRLVLRRWREDDAAPINCDPEVMRMLNRPVDPQAVAAFLDRAREHWKEHGYGWFAVESRVGEERGELIGLSASPIRRSCPRSPTGPSRAGVWRRAAESMTRPRAARSDHAEVYRLDRMDRVAGAVRPVLEGLRPTAGVGGPHQDPVAATAQVQVDRPEAPRIAPAIRSE